MNPFQTLLKSAGTSSIYMSLTSVVAGGAAAAMHGNLEILPLTICLFFGIFAQLSINFSHRYNDEKYHFGENHDDGIDFDTLPETTMLLLKNATISALLLTGMIGLGIIAMGGWMMIIFGVLFVALAWIINVGKHPLVRTPFGLIAKAFAYGPLGTMAVCFLQSQHESVNDFNWYDLGPAVYLGVAAGFMIANWSIIHNYSHYKQDRLHGKRTMTVVLGLSASRVTIVVNALLAFAFIFALCRVCSPNDWQWLVAMPGIGVLIYLWISISLKGADPKRAHRLCNYSGLTMLGVMLAIFFIICFTGIPFDTKLIYF